MASNDLIVVTAATSNEGGTLSLYREQLAKAGIDFHIEDISSQPRPSLGGNSGIKTDQMISLSQRFANYQKIVFTDAFDMTFWSSKDEVISKIPDDHVLWGAEKNCYPDAEIAAKIPDRGPWRFGNGGFLCGTPEAMIAWARKLRTRPDYHQNVLDQQYLNIYLAEQDDFVQIDWKTELVFCLYGGYPELEFVKGKPVNMTYGTYPAWCHANGSWNATEMWDKYERSLQV